MLPWLEQTPEQFQAWLAERGWPGYRAAQVQRWVFKKRADRFDQMTDLPAQFRCLLAEQFRVAVAEANPVTLSIGGVCAPLVTSTRVNALATDTVVSRLLDRADRCVYRAKEAGRDRVDVVSMDPIVWRKPSDKSDGLEPVMRSTPPDSLYQLFSRRPEDFADYPRALDD